jgi:hypothetical protein
MGGIITRFNKYRTKKAGVQIFDGLFEQIRRNGNWGTEEQRIFDFRITSKIKNPLFLCFLNQFSGNGQDAGLV